MSGAVPELLQEGVTIDPQREAIAMRDIAALKVRVARLAGLEVGDRVVFAFGPHNTLHGVVHELARRTADDVPGAWVRVVGHGVWLHFVPLRDVWPVCGLCAECVALNDRPGCASALHLQ